LYYVVLRVRIKMEDEERDREVLEVIAREYSFQWQYFERLEAKLSNCILIAAAIATLYFGLGSFSLERISLTNPLYGFIVLVFLLGVGLFILTITISLWGYRLMKFKNYPNDPKQFIDEHKTSNLTIIIREEAATMADMIKKNRNNNENKARALQRAFWALALGSSMILVFIILFVSALSIS